RRCLGCDWASMLLPDHWCEGNEGPCSAIEDGWEGISGWMGEVAGPATIQFSASEARTTATANKELRECVQGDPRPGVQERGLIDWPGWDTASCVYKNEFGRHLVCVAVRDGRVVSLECEAPPARFEVFRPLFLLVARSVRLGEAAKEGV